MFQLERQEKILKMVNENSTVRTSDLCEIFSTSSVTIRNDINELANRGLLIKSHGGAMSVNDRINLEIPSGKKLQQNIENKRRIAQEANRHIGPDEIIILDSGSTTLEIAKQLKQKNVTVITNDIQIGMVLAEKKNVTLYLTGGRLKPSVHTLMGGETIDYFRRIRVDKLFLGCDAIDIQWGISNRTQEEVLIKQAMMAASRQVLAVSDASKLGRQVFARICGFDQVDTLIIDTISPKDKQALETLGVRVLVTDDGQNKGAD